jgi:protein-S-isoprenylcysteine O-methyltransferase Ste14
MKDRGVGWILVQALLLVLFLVVPRVGPAWPLAGAFQVVGYGLAAAGVAMLAWSAARLGGSLTPFPRPLPGGRLVTSGPYGFVRHPIYLGLLVLCLGWALASTSPLRVAMTVVLFVFFDLKARREEIWLLERYPDYANYRKVVRKLVPGIY